MESKASCTWVIENATTVTNPSNQCRHSPGFFLSNDNAQNYQLDLVLNVKNQLCRLGNDFGFFHLNIFSSKVDSEICLAYNISLLNQNGQKCKTKEGHLKMVNKKIKSNWQYIISRDFLLDPGNKFLVNDKLTIFCEVVVVANDTQKIIEKSNQVDISKDFEMFFKSGKFSDVVLAIGEKEFHVHKVVLAARSKVFAAMFEHDCEEKRLNRIEITDLDVEVCESFLEFLYTGNVSHLDRFASELLAAADKYQLDELKSICEKYLCSELSIESVASILCLADMHNAKQLKTKCVGFITDNAKDVQESDSWKKLFAAKPDLAFQLFLSLANKK